MTPGTATAHHGYILPPEPRMQSWKNDLGLTTSPPQDKGVSARFCSFTVTAWRYISGAEGPGPRRQVRTQAVREVPASGQTRESLQHLGRASWWRCASGLAASRWPEALRDIWPLFGEGQGPSHRGKGASRGRTSSPCAAGGSRRTCALPGQAESPRGTPSPPGQVLPLSRVSGKPVGLLGSLQMGREGAPVSGWQ